MQRGVLTITKEELTQLISFIDMSRFQGTQLYTKLSSAMNGTEDNVKILLSADEIERIMDEAGPPTTDNALLNSAISKISELMVTLRK